MGLVDRHKKNISSLSIGAVLNYSILRVKLGSKVSKYHTSKAGVVLITRGIPFYCHKTISGHKSIVLRLKKP